MPPGTKQSHPRQSQKHETRLRKMWHTAGLAVNVVTPLVTLIRACYFLTQTTSFMFHMLNTVNY